MRSAIFSLLLLSVVGCVKGVNEYKYSLPEESPSAKAKLNIINRNYVLYQVCGYSCNTPGVLSANRIRCYEPYIKVETLDPTGDAINSDGQLKFKAMAAKYAKEYNVLMSQHLEITGTTDCKNGEDWGQAIADIHQKIKEKNTYKMDSAFGYDFRDPNDLEIFLPFNKNPIGHKQLRSDVCGILNSNNIYQTVHIENMENVELFSCNE